MTKSGIRTGNIKVLIVDEYPLFHHGLASVLKNTTGYYIVGTASSVADALEINEKEKPDLVITEIHFKNENGMEIITKLKEKRPEIVILVLSTQDEKFYSERILRLGARGFIMKTESAESVLKAIKTVMAGKVHLSENERDRIFKAVAGETAKGVKDWTNSVRKLSDRELQVFSMIGKGYGTIEIASKLELSTKTIDTHKEHIKGKLRLSSSQELRQAAIEWGKNSH